MSIHPDFDPPPADREEPEQEERIDPAVAKLMGELQAQQRETQLLREQLTMLATQKNQGPSALDELGQREGAGLDPRLMRQAIEEVAAPMVAKMLGETLIPLTNTLRAESEIEVEFPLFKQNRGAITKFLKDNPELRDRYGRMLQTDPLGAYEWAIGRFERAGGKVTRESAADDPSRGGGIPRSKSSMGGSRMVNRNNEEQELVDAKRAYVESSSSENELRLLRAKLLPLIPPKHFEPDHA